MSDKKTETRVDRSPLKQALVALEEMQAKLAASERGCNEPIAIIGMSCRFPGVAVDPEAFWRLLRDGVEAVGDVPDGRWDIDAHYDPDPEAPGKMYTKSGGYLNEVDTFDPQFFGISPREAVGMDPQQRLLLEVSWEALENAGQIRDRLAGSQTGVFVGITSHDYEQIHLESGDLGDIDTYHITGNSLNSAAGRLSYVFGFHGPCAAVDTACSSSLVAIHQACRSLASRECDRALAAGVNLILSPVVHVGLCKTRVLSFEGRCKAFDTDADGMVRGEGCGVLVLKRLSDAQRDGDKILALIRSSAVNQDGPSSGLTVPNGPAQEMLLNRALEGAQMQPSQLSYVEAHGTGTPLGDPIELRALSNVYGKGRTKDTPLLIGSVKTNIGHLEACSGIAGLIKVVLAMQHREIPPHLHFKNPTPHFEWDRKALSVVTNRTPWVPGDAKRTAGVSSFGFSGVNAHVILEEAPVPDVVTSECERPLHLLTLSAKSEAALRESARRYERFLGENASLKIGDFCYSANAGRGQFEERLCIQATSANDAQEKLAAYLGGQENPAIQKSRCKSRAKVAFLFTGQGAQYVEMGRQLYETSPSFRKTMDRCNDILTGFCDRSVVDILYAEGGDETLLNQTAFTQPAIFALEYALAQLWASWGVQPRFVMGHSVGEYAAACFAGVFSLEDGLRLIAERGRLMQALPGGDMVVLNTNEKRAAEAAAPFKEQVSIAAINTDTNVVISGSRDCLQKICAGLAEEGIASKQLTVSHAFHSPLMKPMLEEFSRIAAEIAYHPPRLGFVSNLTGGPVTDELATPEYWTRHVMEPVRFADGMEALREQGVDLYLETGPKPILLGMGQQCLAEGDDTWLPSLRPGRADWAQMLESLGMVYLLGAEVDWRAFDADYHRQRTILPNYPFQRQRYWVEREAAAHKLRVSRLSGPAHPLLGSRLNLAGTEEVRFESALHVESPEYLNDHRIAGAAVLPAAAYMEMALAAGKAALSVERIAVEELVLQAPLLLPENKEVTLQLVMKPSGHRGYGFQILSLQASEKSDLNAWTLHASGRIRELDENNESARPDLNGLRKSNTVSVAVDAFYEQCTQRGIEFGPSFQALETLQRGERTALGRISLSEDLAERAGAYRLHPVLLDAALQVLGALATESSQERVYLPVNLDRLLVYRSAGNQAWCQARLRPIDEEAPKSVTFDFELLADNGERIASIEGLHLAETNVRALIQRETRDFQDWLYEPKWQLQERPTGREKELAPGRWLILADEDGVASQLAELLESQGNACTLVSTGAEFLRTDDANFQIDAASKTHFQRLFRETGGEPWRGIVHLWSIPPGKQSEDDLVSATARICRSLLYLLQTTAEQTPGDLPPLWLVTRGAQVCRPSEKVAVVQSLLWGMGRSAAQEFPNLRCLRVDLDPALEAGGARALFEEMQVETNEDEIAYRGQDRYVSRLTRHDKAKENSEDVLQLHDDATYLITGGCGGLGLSVAGWLVERGARNLALIGRSGLKDDAARAKVDALKERGAQVTIAKADVACEAGLEAALAQLRETLPPLRGVIHAAAVLHDGVIEQQDWERFEQVMAPKVKGAWNLHNQTRNIDLDFFVCFSSAASLWGAPGQSNYSAANSFLDALSHHRQSMGLPALSVNWAAWSEVGVAARQGVDRQLSNRGIDAISPRQGLDVLEYLLSQSVPQVGVLPIRWPAFISLFPQGQEPPLLSDLIHEQRWTQRKSPTPVDADAAFLNRIQEAAGQERSELLASFIQEQVASVLRIQSSQFSMDQPLNTIGVDSLMAVELRNRIRSALHVDMPMVKFLSGQDTVGLSKDLNRLLSEKAAKSPGQSRPDVSVSKADPSSVNAEEILERIDELSEEEVDRLLDAALLEEGKS